MLSDAKLYGIYVGLWVAVLILELAPTLLKLNF